MYVRIDFVDIEISCIRAILQMHKLEINANELLFCKAFSFSTK